LQRACFDARSGSRPHLVIRGAILAVQRVSFGLIGGMSATDAVESHTTMDTILVDGTYVSSLGTRWWSQSKDSLAGAMFENGFSSHVSAEADGMYRELHATWGAGVLPDGTLNTFCRNR
jgi:hypothetical protein